MAYEGVGGVMGADDQIDPGRAAAIRAGYGQVYDQAYQRAQHAITTREVLGGVSARPGPIFR